MYEDGSTLQGTPRCERPYGHFVFDPTDRNRTNLERDGEEGMRQQKMGGGIKTYRILVLLSGLLIKKESKRFVRCECVCLCLCFVCYGDGKEKGFLPFVGNPTRPIDTRYESGRKGEGKGGAKLLAWKEGRGRLLAWHGWSGLFLFECFI